MPTPPLVFLVDDDHIVNYLHAELLRHFDPGIQVRTALNGQEGLALLRAHCQTPPPRCPVLVLLDLNMPVLDGFEFLEAYQHLPATERQGVVVFMLTSSVSPRDLERVRRLPVAGFLAKPLTKEMITQVLADHFSSR